MKIEGKREDEKLIQSTSNSFPKYRKNS
jgi:hypothetical protein